MIFAKPLEPRLPHATPETLSQNASAAEVKLEKGCRRCRRNRQAAAAVEFAVVAPVFLLMVFGIFEFGRAMMVQQVLTNASRAGTRVAILDSPTSHNDVVSTVNNWLMAAQLPTSTATITMTPDPPNSANYGEPVTVTVKIPYSSVSWVPVPQYFSGSVQLTGTTVMRRETVQTSGS